MTEDDDWFERALREDGEDETDADGDTAADDADTGTSADDADTDTSTDDADSSEPADDAEVGDVAPDESGADAFGGGGFADAPEFGAPGDDSGPDDLEGDVDSPVEDDAPSDDPAAADSFGDDPTAADSFGDDPTAADSPGDGFGDAQSSGFADADPYDGDADDGDDLFDDDFATAFENAPGGAGPANEPDDGSSFGGGGAFGGDADEGFGGLGAGPADDDGFDDEEFETDIPRIDLGIDGLDSMIQGGVPERSLITTIGSAGTGKTTFGLQFLQEALREGENAVFITLEESRDRILNTAAEKGWDFEAYVEDDQLAVIDLDPIEMANSLTSIRNDLPRLVADFEATRLVLDSVSLLEMMYDDQATRRNEVYDFTKSLKEAGVTTMLTSEASEDNAYASRHGIIEYLVDAVFVLRYIRSSDDFRETRLAVEIQKIRDANHSREIKPYAITNEGISVYRQANIF